uniref:Uncharacterized protein n=1 Tax=Chromera velia CCMP2878 TaxID=1169474 RepID=A0A0G4IEL8_9ALVE|eukprot:Cvel_2416.t1-p1 / transcript=Cvel_2416.t1 / gene=Cvel_2416 / organism=Chromera_velia_CCMP2878 / gene_product=hypothetical protein / transcript_product=hypothetical protein / location=Cvel_scaffold94:93081-94328(-) / protein_length=416 / sequence_SO=supercontig / SO=protein_coding / is_pseudo=false
MAGRAFLDRLAADVAKRPKDVEALAKLAGLGAGERGSAFSTKIPPKVLVAAGLNGGDGKAGDGPEVDRLYPEDLPSLCTKMIFAGVRDPDLWGPLEMRLVSLLQQDGGRSFGAAHLALISQAFGSVGASRALSETVERCSQLSLQRDEMSLADLACVLEGLSRASRGCGGRNSHADRGLGGDGEGRRGEFVRCSAQFVSERARTEIGLMAPDLVACLAVGLSKLLQGEGRPLQEKGGEGRLVVEALEAVGDALMEVEEGSSGMSVVEKRFVCRDMALVAGAFASAGVRTARLFEEIGRCAVEGVRREIADGGGRRERDGGIEMSVGLLLTSLFKGNLGERSREQVLRDVAPVIFLRLAPEGSGGGEGGRRDREAAERLGDVEQSSRWSGLGALANGLKRHSAGRTRDGRSNDSSVD